MFCYNCGKEINDKAVVCIGCGVSVGVSVNDNIALKDPLAKKETMSIGTNKHFLVKYNWIFSLLSITLSVSVFAIAILGIDAYPQNAQYIIVLIDTVLCIVMCVLASMSFLLGLLSACICVCFKTQDAFKSFLAFLISLTTLIFAILASI